VRILFLAAILVLAVPGVAAAQSTGVGGDVNSQMTLSLDQPAKGFAAFRKARSYTTTLQARVTATDGPMLLSIADGDATHGSKRGHLRVGSKRLKAPLEAKVGSAAFQPLDASVEGFITACWDIGLEIGSSVRSVEECIAEGERDVTVQTALLESRLVAGSRSVFRAFGEACAASMDAKAFLRAKTLEMRHRHLN
jgi:hypothetical protein